MTPQELKEIALKSSKSEAENIELQLHEAAKKGHLSCEFVGLSEGVINHLRERGFKITGDIFNAPFLSIKEKKYTISFS